MAAIAEQQEPEVALRQMTDGHKVIEDYSHTGLTLRQHPIAFLRKDFWQCATSSPVPRR
jgi:error-prone DNA polymerase